MKPILLAVLAAPLLLAGCSTYVGYDGDGYYGPPGYYDGVTGDVAIYGYDRGGYQPHYHHYDGGGYRGGDVSSRGFSHASGGTRVASAGHSSGHVSGASHSASVSAGHSHH